MHGYGKDFDKLQGSPQIAELVHSISLIRCTQEPHPGASVFPWLICRQNTLPTSRPRAPLLTQGTTPGWARLCSWTSSKSCQSLPPHYRWSSPSAHRENYAPLWVSKLLVQSLFACPMAWLLSRPYCHELSFLEVIIDPKQKHMILGDAVVTARIKLIFSPHVAIR